MKYRLLFCTLLSLLSLSGFTQVRPGGFHYRMDADSLYAGIKEIHPDMFAQIAQDEWEAMFITARNSLDNWTTPIGFYKSMAPVIALLGDGHTGLNFPTQVLIDNETPVFPLAIRIDKQQKNFYVKGAYNGIEAIPIGARITAINRYTPEQIIDSLTRYISGEKEFFKLEVLEYTFPALFSLLCRDSVFSVYYEWQGSPAHAAVRGCLYTEIDHRKVAAGGKRGYTLEIPDRPRTTAVMTLDRCDVDLEDYNKFLDSCFNTIRNRNIEHLVVDIRSNGGGDSRVADELFEYISPVPFTQCDKIVVKISEKIKRTYGFPEDQVVGTEVWSYEPEPLKGYPARFKGEVFLLISNYTFSAAADLAWAFKHYKMGTVIGEESGGLGVCYGDSAHLRLPYSNLSCGVSFKRFYNVGADESSTHGVIPDFEVPAADALDHALKMIGDKK